jgi:Domain of unknown function (DUF4020)/SIR2-like domain
VWAGGVEIPSKLFEAHREGRLVLFVGAGASRDVPSDLPDFRHLTKKIAEDAHYALNDGDLDHPDVLLGRIEDQGVDVRLRVEQQLSDPESKHNRLHEAIVELGLTSQRLRIVTTNFDRHLSSAIAAREVRVEEYLAPALPMGNDFAGLVYLHGTLGQPPSRLVVTDGDFGRAYLRDAWAARFLERMFAEFSVLFIGYSHGDVVMRYLARALGPDGHRYVLTDAPEARDWTELGLQPLGYEVVDGSHANLGDALDRWAEIAGMGLLDHRARIASLVSSPPSGIPEETSYVEELITDPDRARLFTEFARTIEWLDWASTQPIFKSLLTRRSEQSDAGRHLADWFVQFYVMEEEHTGRALMIVSENGGHLGPEVCDALGFHLNSSKGPRGDWLGIWLVLLLRDAPAAVSHWLDYALKSSEWPAHREQLLLLFDHLTEPVAGLGSSFGMGQPSVGIHLLGGDHWLQEAWTRILKLHLKDVALDVAAMADRHLRRAHQLQAATRGKDSNWDEVSFNRNTIGHHNPDRHTEPIDVLVDAARDALEALLDAAHPMATGYLQSWAEADSQVLRRLALYGWTHRSDVDASTKLDWVVRTGWLFDYQIRPELFRLIANALPAASDKAVRRLVAAASKQAKDESKHRPYERFNALVWMNRSRPDHPVVKAALAKAHSANPGWQERPDPDLTHSMEVGVVPSRPPMSVESFIDQLDVEPSTALTSLDQYKGVGPWDDGPAWSDALALIRSAAQISPRHGHTLLNAAPEETEVVQAVINGWSSADLDEQAAAEVVERVVPLNNELLVRDLSRMLTDGGRSESHPTNWTAVVGARQLARELWPLVPNENVMSEDADWLSRAINHPAGHLAEFWLRVVEHEWRADEDNWSGLTEEHRAVFETMLAGPQDETATQMAEVILASRLSFLFAADQAWTVDHLMRLFDWSDPPRAHRAWASFTTWGRWNEQMLDVGLMEQYLSTVQHLDELKEAEQARLLGHLAGVALTSERDPMQWLPAVIVQLSDEQRSEFADKVAEILGNLPSEAVEHQWARWMHEYWTGRLASVPTKLSIAEASAMAGWVPFLTSSFEVGVQLAMSRTARFREHDDVLRHLERRVEDSPDLCTRLIGHLLRSTEPPWWGGYKLRKMMPQLRKRSQADSSRVLDEQTLRLGMLETGDG